MLYAAGEEVKMRHMNRMTVLLLVAFASFENSKKKDEIPI